MNRHTRKVKASRLAWWVALVGLLLSLQAWPVAPHRALADGPTPTPTPTPMTNGGSGPGPK